MKAHFSTAASKDAQYVIVAATTKAASTSLYVYLSEHPEVTAIIQKEVGYWLDEDYPSKMGFRHTADEDYTSCFPEDPKEKVWLDVTPDYLYSAGTPTRLKENLSNLKIYFSLREPIDRIISKYRYLIQTRRLSSDIALADYIDQLFDQEMPLPYSIPQPYRTLDQSNYWPYLERYLEVFSKEELQVVYFEHIKQYPADVMKFISNQIGIDKSFYEDYPFAVVNPTRTINNNQVERGYHSIRKKLSAVTDRYPAIHEMGRRVKTRVEPVVYWLNGARKNNLPEIEKEQLQRLIAYYRPGVVKLNEQWPVPDSWRSLYKL